MLAPDLLPQQAPPYRVPEIEGQLTKLREGAKIGGWTYKKKTNIGRTFRAVTALLAQAGFRGSEVSLGAGVSFTKKSLKRCDISWRFESNGEWIHDPSPAQLRKLKDGDLVKIIPPPSKADRFGTKWGNNPIYLVYSKTAVINAARELAAIELAQPCRGQSRVDTPLFVDNNGAMITRRALQDATRDALRRTGVPEARAKQLTLHSYRRYLACALLGQGVSELKICALLRWASTKSLHEYAKLMPDAYAGMIADAVNTDIDCVITSRLPLYDAFQVATNMAHQAEEFEEAAGRDGALEYDVVDSD